VLGESAKFSAGDQARLLGHSWERVENSDKLRTQLVTYKLSGEIQTYLLGAHAPTLTPDDLDLIHKLWLEAAGEIGVDVHHRDIVRVALEKLRGDIEGGQREEAMERIRRQARRPAVRDTDVGRPSAPTAEPTTES
jgi:hypothetical protein